MPPELSRPELPGFIFDEVKNRYVKILPNHVAKTMSGRAAEASHENAEDIKACRKRQRSKSSASNCTSIDFNRPRGSKLQRHHVHGFSLNQQIGRINLPRDQTFAWTSLLEPQNAFGAMEKNDSWIAIQKDFTNSTLIGVKYDKERPYPEACQLTYVRPGTKDGPYTYRSIMPCFSKITSLDVTNEECFIATYDRKSPNYIAPILPPRTNGSPTRPVVAIKKTHDEHDYWCTAFHPDQSRPRIAIGTEAGVIIQNPYCSHGHGLQTYLVPPRQRHQEPATRAIQWLSQNVVIAGRGDGTVKLFDVRGRDCVLRLRHERIVLKMKCADDKRILLGGPRSLSMYDLRYNKPIHKTRNSRPWLKYHRYDNTRILSNDIDISTRISLMAVALERETEIWNLWTGERIRTLSAAGSWSGVKNHGFLELPYVLQHLKSKMVQFTRDNHSANFFEEDSDPTGILAGDDVTVREWSVARTKDDDSDDSDSDTSF